MIFQASFYKSKKLLLIEDCEPVRASIKGMLQQIGFEDIIAVADATQAMPLAMKDNFDFILADFDLGSGKDALQFFAELSQQALLRVGCCFILLSAEPRRMPVLGILQGAPDSFLLKPFSYLELEKRLAKAWNNRVKLRKAYQALQAKDLKTAQLELDQIINAVNSSSLLALRLMAEVLLTEGSYAAALKLYEQVSQQRDFSWAKLGKAVAILQTGEYGTAEALLLPLLEQDDIRPEALEWLACLYLRQADIDQTAKHLTELIKLQPTHAVAQQSQACILLQQGQPDAAIKHWHKLIQLYRFSAFDRATYYFSLTRLLLDQAAYAALNEFPAAIKKAGEALASMPQKLLNEHTDSSVQVLRARLSLLQGNIADAKQQLTQLSAPDHTATPEALLDRARLAFALGDIKAADATLALLADYQIVSADLHAECQRLTAHYLLQHEQQLRGQIRQWNQTGMEQAQAGNSNQALALLRQAFMFMPCNPALVLNLLQVLGQMPFERTLKPLVKTALLALEFSTKTAANQQRLTQIMPQLPQTYLD
jgi:tetratricopeptide (TPR) repeat protein